MSAVIAAHCLIFLVVLCGGSPVEKRTFMDKSVNDYPDYLLGVRYDEYPLIVPKKRTALLVNRLMIALKQAMEEEEKEEAFRSNLEGYNTRASKTFPISSDDIRSMDLQRRGPSTLGQQKGRSNYWRCYFNAVTCF